MEKIEIALREPAGESPEPIWIRARGGSIFNLYADTWKIEEIGAKVRISFLKLPVLQEGLELGHRRTLAWYAQNRSATSVKTLYDRMFHFLKFRASDTSGGVEEISSVQILNYKSSLGREREWYLANVRAVLKRWHKLGYGGISIDCIKLLGELRIRSNPKGVSTLTMDPRKGPFTSIEFEGLQSALNSAYSQNTIDLGEYVLCWLFMAFGSRPIQYAALKVCDVLIAREKSGSVSYLIRMPRAKMKNGQLRSEFKNRMLVPELGRLVYAYAEQVKARFVGFLDDPTQAPLFPKAKGGGSLSDQYHQTSARIGTILTKTLEKLEVSSERINELINITARRFRSTLGTRAAEEGHGELVIAELLDHSDTQNAHVYVSLTPAITERIDRAVAMSLAPLAQAFAGKLIERPSAESRGSSEHRLIRAPAITGDFEPISSCGKHGFCGFLKPIACYTCKSFKPWLDGPHEEVLLHLLAERDRLVDAGDSRIASINDRTILAVAEVIQLCAAEIVARAEERCDG